MRFLAVLTLAAAIGELQAGTQIKIPLPEPIDGEAEARVVADNLLMGSLAPHCRVKAGDGDAVNLYATRACSCFGVPIAREQFEAAAKAGRAITMIAFEVPLDDPKHRVAFAELLRTGALHGKVQMVVQADIPAKPQRTAPANTGKAPAPANTGKAPAPANTGKAPTPDAPPATPPIDPLAP